MSVTGSVPETEKMSFFFLFYRPLQNNSKHPVSVTGSVSENEKMSSFFFIDHSKITASILCQCLVMFSKMRKCLVLMSTNAPWPVSPRQTTKKTHYQKIPVPNKTAQKTPAQKTTAQKNPKNPVPKKPAL